MITQNSKIQVRSGLKQNLPLLSQGEFGWCVDSLELFIGNGNVQSGSPYEGNTEILTSANNQISKPYPGVTSDGNLGLIIDGNITGVQGTLQLGPNDTEVDPVVLGINPQIYSAERLVVINPLTPLGVSIGNLSISNNILTVSTDNSFSAGQKVEFVLMSPATFLNGAIVTILSVTPTEFTAEYNHPDYGPIADSGTVENYSPITASSIVMQTDPSLFYEYVAGQFITSTCTTNSNITISDPPIVFPGGITGLDVAAYHNGSGTITGTMYGVIGASLLAGIQNGGGIDTIVGCLIDLGNAQGGKANKAYGLFITSNGDPDGNYIDSYGIYISSQNSASATNRWGLYIDNQVDANVQAIHTGTGPIEFGDILYLGGNAVGNVTINNPATSNTVTFTHPIIGSLAPIVQITPTSDPNALGGYWVTPIGSTRDWTGFTVNVHTAPASAVTFNYTVVSTNNF